jgi:signal transduction histidine kinase
MDPAQHTVAEQEAKQRLLDQILQLDPETSWTREEIEGADGARSHLEKYFHKLLNSVADFAEADHAYVAISGLQCGEFTPVVAVKRPLEGINPTATTGQQNAVARFLWNKELIDVITEPTLLPEYKGLPGVREKWLIKLVGHGELVGFISLDRLVPHPDAEHLKKSLRLLVPQLTWRMAEQLFSLRLRQLAHPFNVEAQASNPDALFDQITNGAVRGFAADGVILHLFDASARTLQAVAQRGNIPLSLGDSQFPGEGICGTVWSDANNSWAIGQSPRCSAVHGLGAEVDEREREALFAAGVEAFVVMRLETEGMASRRESLGTLSLLHARRHSYSWRDVALLRSFSARVADTLALQRQTTELKDRTNTLERQAKMLTRVEVFALLAHDLMHKSFAACQALDKYIETCNTTFRKGRERKEYSTLDELAKHASDTALSVQTSMSQVRALYRNADVDAESKSFDLNDIVDSILNTLDGALSRSKISVKKQLPRPMIVFGPPSVLEQVVFNLIINAIDSIKTLNKNGSIFVEGRVDEQGTRKTAVLQIEDNGPGIDPHFSNPQDIFHIGTTTKKDGTGTGLSVARSLLGTHYSGNLVLKRARPALFEITIPLGRDPRAAGR